MPVPTGGLAAAAHAQVCSRAGAGVQEGLRPLARPPASVLLNSAQLLLAGLV